MGQCLCQTACRPWVLGCQKTCHLWGARNQRVCRLLRPGSLQGLRTQGRPFGTQIGLHRRAAQRQVWPLTQFYAVDFSQSGIGEKRCVFNKSTIKVRISCLWWEIRAWRPPHLMVSMYLCSSGSNARGEPRALEGRHVSSKSPSRVRDRDEGVAGTNERE